jgi:hypothetical protein
MAVLVVGAEKNFAALRPRLFTGRVSTRIVGEVADAIRAANPHVNLDKLTPGVVLTIPDAPRVRLERDLSLDEATRRAIEGLGTVGKAQLDDVFGRAKAREEEDAAERKRLSAALDGRNLAAATRSDPQLKENIAFVRGLLQELDGAAKQRSAMLKEAQSEWAAELEKLTSTLDHLI